MNTTVRDALSCVLALLFLAACSDADFRQEQPETKEPAFVEDKAEQSPPLNKRRRHSEQTNSGEDRAGETDRALPPHEVSGSYLACVPVASTHDEEAVGCAIVREGSKQIFSNTSMTWFLTDGSGNSLPFAVKNARLHEPWHVVIRSSATLAGAHLRVEWREPNRELKILQTTITSGMIRAAQTTPDQAYHIGDGSFHQSSCANELISLPTHGTEFRALVKTDHHGPWLVTLRGLCGVDGPGMARLVVTTESATTSVVNSGSEKEISLWIPAQTGKWSIAIIAEDRTRSDVEDFLFTGLEVLGGGDVALEIH